MGSRVSRKEVDNSTHVTDAGSRVVWWSESAVGVDCGLDRAYQWHWCDLITVADRER